MVRLAAGLTVYLVLVDVLLLWQPNPPAGDWVDLAAVFVGYSFYLAMLVRWPVVLALLVQRVRAVPGRFIAVRLAVVCAVQVPLGVLSLVGGAAMLVETRLGERLLGFFFQAVIPATMVVYLARTAASRPVVPGGAAWAR